MVGKIIRLLGWFAAAAIGLWWGRLVVHSKHPPPEGRWRETDIASGPLDR